MARPKKSETPISTPAAEPASPTLETTAAAAAPPAEIVATLAGMPYREVPVTAVFASPLNPRKSKRSPEEARALALSVAKQGVLQPLLVRPTAQTDIEGERFEIIFGEGRFDAARTALAGIADDDGTVYRLPGTWLLPIRIHPCDDDELVVLAAIENLDRADMAPLDEAELYATLRPRVKPRPGERPEAAIARLVHVGERTVFRRLALTRLAPELTTALRDQAITLSQAQAFALGHHNDQRRLWKESSRGENHWQVEPDRIRSVMTAQRVPVENALFDPALYQGEIVADAETGEGWFADATQFARLQGEAAKAKAEELRRQWPWVEVYLGDTLYRSFAVHDVKQSDKRAGAVIHLDPRTHQAKIHAPALRRQDADADEQRRRGTTSRSGGKGKAEPTQRAPLTEAQVKTVHAAKTQAMRRAVIANPKAALAAAVLGLLGEAQIRGLGGHGWEYPHGAIASADSETAAIVRLVTDAAEALPLDQRPKAGKLPRLSTGHDPDYRYDERHDPRLWFRRLYQLDDAALTELHTRLVAERIGSWHGFNQHQGAWFGDTPLAVEIAETVDAAEHLPELWRPDEEFFKAYGKDRLIALGLHCTPKSGGRYNRKDLAGMKKGDLANLLATQPPPGGTWTPQHFPECTFQLEVEAKRALEDPQAMAEARVAAINNPSPAMREREGPGAERREGEGPDSLTIELDDGGGEDPIPVLIKFDTPRGFGAYAVDPALPFISHTGYMSFTGARPRPNGESLARWAAAEIAHYLATDDAGKPRKKPRALVAIDAAYKAGA